MAGTCKKCGGMTTDTRAASKTGECFNCEHGLERDKVAGGQEAGEQMAGGQETVHPFSDSSRRVDVVLYPPIPGAVIAYKKVTINACDERGIEFTDEKGNYYRAANMPILAVSFDPRFDPDTEGRLVRGSA